MTSLNSLILGPLLGAGLIALIPRQYRFVIRLVALATTLFTLLCGVALFTAFPAGSTGFFFEENIPWVSSLGINYHVGADGLNIGLILMGTIVAFAAVCVSHSIQKLEKEFYFLLLVMTGGILGAFASLDLFFFYFFHELALVPTFIMIGVWGRGENRNFATFQITMYLSAGALLALIGLIGLYLQLPVDARTFDIPRLTEYFRNHPMDLAAQHRLFPLLLFGFGILVSLWPFHTWAAPGYGTAPAATAMLHAGVLKKFGLYGLLRVALPFMPEAAQSWLHIIAFLCLGNIVYCGWVAMRQRDLNLLIGNSSVAHMGFCFLGIASFSLLGLTGAVVVMVAHGLLAALTFGLSGYIYDQTGTLDTRKLGGLLRQMPFIGAALVMAMMAGCGLPGFANFAGEVMVLFSAWSVSALVTVAAIWGASVIGAIYMLRAIRHVLHGPLSEKGRAGRDASSLWRKLPFALLLATLLLFGFVPALLTDKVKPAVASILEMALGPQTEQDAFQRRLEKRAMQEAVHAEEHVTAKPAAAHSPSPAHADKH